jgi:HSP20 family molecular chaperone IbpA
VSRVENGYSASQELAEQYRLQREQKQSLQDSHEAEIQNLKKSHVAESEDLQDRFESSSQAQRLAHYEHLRNQKNQINREERDLQSRGRESIAETKRELETEAFRTEQEGRTRVEDNRKRYAALEQYERQKERAAQDDLHRSHIRNTELIVKNTEKTTNDLREQKEAYLEVQKENHRASLEGIRDHYQKIRDEKHQNYLDELRQVEHRTTASLNERKLASAEKLKAQDTRANDPFYRIKHFESAMEDQGESILLRVRVPEHERKGVRVQVSGKDLELIGTRVADERAMVEPGRVISSRSHQILSERFSLPAPVDPKSVSMREDGDWIEYRMTKFGPHHPVSGPAAHQIDQDLSPIAQELRFVENLPRPSVMNQQSGKGTLT